MPFELVIKESFSAAHFIPDYAGDCSRLHGHNYVVEVVVSSETLDSMGFVIDFRKLRKIVKEAVGFFDHQNLNELEPFKKLSPSAENLALIIYREVKRRLPSEVQLREVRVWENPESAAVYREGSG